MLLRTMGATVGRYGVREATQPSSLNLKAAPTKQEVGREVLPQKPGCGPSGPSRSSIIKQPAKQIKGDLVSHALRSITFAEGWRVPLHLPIYSATSHLRGNHLAAVEAGW